jgi:hypothetical protein
VGLHIAEPKGSIGNQIVESVHDDTLGKDREFLEGTVVPTPVRLPVKGGMLVDVSAKLRQRSALLSLQFAPAPTVAS